MVRHFVRLKLRILANRIRSQSLVGTIGYFLMWALGLLVGVGFGFVVYLLGRQVDQPQAVLMFVYVLVFLGWMILPATVSALDETLDPRRFELLPLSPRRLTAGLLVAGAVSPGGLGTIAAIGIATVATYPGWRVLPVALVAVLIELVMCLVVARLVTTLLSNLLSSRRTREAVTLGFGLLIAAVAVLPGLLDPDSGFEIVITIESFDWVTRLVWLPPGALARAVGLADDGAWLSSLALLGYGAVAAWLIGLGWSRSVRRMLVSAPASGGSRRRREDSDRTLALFPSWLKIGGPIGGVVGKELRYVTRDNRVRAQLIGSFVPIVAIAFMMRSEVSTSPFAPFLATGISFLIVLGILANQFGFDGGSFWAYVVSPVPLATVVRGKNLGWAIVALPPVVIVAFAMAVWSGEFSYVAAAVFGGAGVLLIAMAIGNFTSIYGAYRVPDTNLFGSKGATGAVFFAVLLSTMVSGLLLLPLAALVALPTIWIGPWGGGIGAAVGIGYGTLIYWLAMRLVGKLLEERQLILLETIDKDLG